jgi:hypothetical protein
MRTLVLAIALVLAACSPAAPSADSPGATVQAALARLAAKDVAGLRTLACAGQEDLVREQLGLAGVSGTGAELIPGIDGQALLDAVTFDTGGLRLGDAAIDGDVATVPVTGSAKVTFDSAAMRPILERMLAEQGQTMTDEQLDALLQTLAAYAQDVPVDQTIRLVREGGAWKICQASFEVPAAS